MTSCGAYFCLSSLCGQHMAIFIICKIRRNGLSIYVVPLSIYMHVILDHVFFSRAKHIEGVERKNIWLSVEVKSLSLSLMKYESYGVKHFISQNTWHHFLPTLRFFSPVDTSLPWSPTALLNSSKSWSLGGWTSGIIGILKIVQIIQ